MGKLSNKLLNQALKANTGLSITAVLLRMLAAAVWVCSSYSLSWLLDGYTKGGSEFNKNALLVLGIMILLGIVAFVSDLVRGLFIRQTNLWMRKKITRNLVNNSKDLLSSKNTGKKISWYINDVTDVENKYYANLIDCAYHFAMIVFAFVAIVIVHWIFAVAAGVIFLATLFIPHFVNNFVEAAQKKLTLAKEEHTESVRDNLESIYTLFIADKLDYFCQRMDKQSERQEKKYWHYNITMSKTSVLLFMVNFLSQAGLIIFSLYIANLGYVTIGSVLSVGALAGNLFNGVQGLMQSISLLGSVAAITDKYKYDVESNKVELSAIDNIELKNVTFNYAKRNILTNLSQNFGKLKYALIGESGSGKSTLLKLLLGINQASAGEVLVNNENIKLLDLKSYFKHLAYIEQNVYLLNESIRENILLGSTLPDDKLARILQIAKLETFIANLPDGLDTVVSSNGQEISGGERQRIAIARALVKDVDFLFIDEATSQLDPVNRLEIENILLDLPNVGVVMISHNFDEATLAKFDKVIKLS